MVIQEPGTKRGRRATVPAKLAAPTPANVVQRTRLFHQLDTACHKPVVWIGASAGSGKTTLVSSYLAARKIKPLWYQIDSRDADPASFFAYLRDAVASLAPRKRETLPLLTPEYLAGIAVYTRNFFEILFARLRPPAVLVFDNFQDLPEQSILHQLLPEALSIVPKGVTVMILSRNSPPAGFIGLQVKQSIALLGAEEMSLTLQETKEIASLHSATNLSPAMLETLHAHTLGWAAGITLSLEHMQNMPPEQAEITRETREMLFDYFASEVFERSALEEQRFLAATAVLPQITVEAAQQLTGEPAAGAMFARLVKSNYFTMRLAGSIPRYQYHPLFREFLLARGPAVLQSEWPLLRRRAADLLVESGLVEEAIAELAEQGDWIALAPLVLHLAPQLAATGRFATLQRWLQCLPPDSGGRNPWVLYWLGNCQMVGDITAARRSYEDAFNIFRNEHQADGMLLAWAGIVDTVINAVNDIRELDLWINTLEAIISDHGPLGPPLVDQVAPRFFPALVLCRPHHPLFAQWRTAATNAFEAEQNPSLKLLSGYYLFAAAIWMADLSEANAMLSRLREIGEAPAALPVSRILRELAEAHLECTRGNAVEGQRAIETGLAISEQTGIHIWTAALLTTGTFAAHLAGNIVLAAKYLAQLKAFLPYARKMDRAYYHNVNGWHAALLGNSAEAQAQMEQAVHLQAGIGGLYFEADMRVGMAQARALNGNRDERDRECREAERIGKLLHSPLMNYTTAFLSACFALDDGDEARARILSENAMQLGRISGFRNFNWWLPDQAARLCGFALRHNIEPAYVRELIRLRGLLPAGDNWQLESWPWHIKIHTLGRFALLVDDKPSSLAARAQNKTLELLKVLIALGGREVPDEKLSEALWPEAEGDFAHQNFKVTLHRLRKLIGADALVVQDGKLTLDTRYAWVDAWAFERLLGAMEDATREDEMAELAGKAIKLYGGAFLKGEDGYWALTMRERQRSKFLRIIGKATDQLCSRSLCTDVIACLQKGIEIDPITENFYQGLMKCHLCLQQAAEGLAVYQRCREVLQRELAVPPSGKTAELHARLLQLAN